MTGAGGNVLVTPRSFAREDSPLVRELEQAVAGVRWARGVSDSAELGRLVPGIDGWIAGVEQIDRSVLDHAERLKVIARYGVGTDNVDVEYAAERGIVVTNTPGANAGAVAELTVGLLIAVARGIPAADRAVRRGAWTAGCGVALEGRVLGLYGFGAIGQAVAERVSGMRMQIRAYDPVAPVEAAARLGVTLVAKEELVATSDFLSLHVPILPQTRGMVDAAFLAAMKPGAFLINAARGDLVDEAALAQALRDGHLAGAALDALAEEPPPPGFALGALENVILTPHTGAHTDRARAAMARMALDNCLAVLRGEPPLDPVAPGERLAGSRAGA